jgi:glycolate oxidase FAD binding subunit
VCGSGGRLAFVARASFRLHPLPAAARTLVVEPVDMAAAVAALLSSHLEPSALDVLHPGRIALLFEGAERAVAAQLERARSLVGGAEADPDVWDESRRRQAEAVTRVRFAPGDLPRVLAELGAAIVRPGAGVAYAAGETPRYKLLQGDGDAVATAALVARIKRELDPRGILA